MYADGYKLYAVQTASMHPAIATGDVVLVRPQATPRSGDIISYRDATNPELIVTHRIVSRAGATITTKGDAMSAKDRPITHEQVVGRVLVVLPHLGAWIGSIKSPLGIAVVCGVPAVVILWQEYRRLLHTTGKYTYTLR